MDRSKAPEIDVGIVRAAAVSLILDGRFRLRSPGNGREKEWRTIFQGAVKVTIRENRMELTVGDHTQTAMDPMILEPAGRKPCRFIIRNVVIGIGFHWEREEDQVFQGKLKLMVSGGQIQVVNIIPVEDYLISVISSEMRGDSSPALLRSHTIISRSWLLAQIEKHNRIRGKDIPYEMIRRTGTEYIRWYDREEHEQFHVCADDHCQRYQGITRAGNPEVVKAVRETTGEVLEYGGAVCDARFSKCCGGVTELFENCWEPVSHPYLCRVDDNPRSSPVNTANLKIEANAVRFIEDEPAAFCNTGDVALLKQVLNDYDRESAGFYRWEVTYSQQELSSMIRKRSGIDFGKIADLLPLERGESGRLVRLKVVGTKRTMTVGKELEIRRWLSTSHLYSAAFIVKKHGIRHGIPARFTLRGAGWGHGVGLCQIGAAVMANRGYTHTEILEHYFNGATIVKRYE